MRVFLIFAFLIIAFADQVHAKDETMEKNDKATYKKMVIDELKVCEDDLNQFIESRVQDNLDEETINQFITARDEAKGNLDALKNNREKLLGKIDTKYDLSQKDTGNKIKRKIESIKKDACGSLPPTKSKIKN